MSIEAKPSSNSYENSPNNREFLPIPETTETPTAADLRKQVRPDHKPSLLEKLDTRGKKFTAALVLAGVLGGLGYGASKVAEGLGNNNEDKEPGVAGPILPGQTETTAPVAGEPTPSISPSNIAPLETAEPSSAPGAETLSTIGIEANQSDEKMVEDFIETLSAWSMAGATPEAKAARTSEYGNLTLEAYAEKIANEQTAIYAPKLFGKDYASNMLIRNTVEGLTEGHKKNIRAYLQTSGTTNPVNKEAYTRNTVLDSFTPQSIAGADKYFTINYHETDNSEKNIIGAAGKSEVNGLKGSVTIALEQTGEDMTITTIKFSDAQS